jgi:glycosyltransferase involved in cell wall biosynthesis
MSIEPIRVAWMTKMRKLGNAFGFAIHSERSQKAVQAHGVVIDPEADICVHVGSPTFWFPVKGKRNILYMSWECHDLPASIAESIARADGVVVSSPFLYETMQRTLPNMPCEIARLGVDAEKFTYLRRTVRATGQPFTFLYVGAANKRKGWEIINHAWHIFGELWKRVITGLPREPLLPTMYFKVTAADEENRERDFIRGDDGKIMYPRTVWDNRKISLDELVELYHAADIFLLPSYGECPGLTALEAAATGLPCFITPMHGLRDSFPPGTAVPLQWDWTDQDYMEVAYGDDLTPVMQEDLKGLRMPQARAHGLAMHMLDSINDYPRYARIGKIASDRVHGQMTWNDCGRDLANALRKIAKGWGKK